MLMVHSADTGVGCVAWQKYRAIALCERQSRLRPLSHIKYNFYCKHLGLYLCVFCFRGLDICIYCRIWWRRRASSNNTIRWTRFWWTWSLFLRDQVSSSVKCIIWIKDRNRSKFFNSSHILFKKMYEVQYILGHWAYQSKKYHHFGSLNVVMSLESHILINDSDTD